MILGTARGPRIDEERIARLLASRRARLVGHPLTFTSHYFPERAVLFAEAFARHAGTALPLRWAHAFAHVLENVALEILPDEVFVGEPGVGRVDPAAHDAACRYLAERREGHVRKLPTYPLEELYTSIGAARSWHGRSGHNIPAYADVLARGVGDLRREAADALAALEPTAPDHADRATFYQAALISLDAFSEYVRRHARLARDLASDNAAADPVRSADLLDVADTCERIAVDPPRDLREALQLVWLLHLATKLEDGGVGHSFGRLDQYCYPFYLADLQSGCATREDLVLLLAAFWIKVNAECEEAMHLTVGGLTPDGGNATNDLSHAVLEAERRVSLIAPNLSARVHRDTPNAFWRDIARTIRRGVGHPAVFGDDVTLEGLMRLGVPAEIARDYAKVGCVETFFAGRAVPWIDCYVSIPKCLELVLTGGRCLLTGRPAGEPGPGAAGIASFEELQDRLDSQVRYLSQLILSAKAGFDQALFSFQAAPFQSAVTPSCLARGRDLYDGGAEYHLTGAYLVGLATAADSLAAIRRVVFEERSLSLPELVEALRADFATPGGEALRQRLLACPKYGNDDDAVDELAQRLVRTFGRAVVEAPVPAGWLSFPMIGSVWGHIQMGAATAATADGRRQGQALSDGGSPSQGRSRLGATAALRSVAKLDHRLIPGGEAINLTLSPGSLAGELGLDNLVALLRAYFSLGGEQIQVNVVSRSTLEAAQADPDSHRHLVVRVAGFCAFFTCLDAETQREIIARTEHVV